MQVLLKNWVWVLLSFCFLFLSLKIQLLLTEQPNWKEDDTIKMKMFAAQFDESGSTKSLSIEEVEIPEINQKEVLIEVYATAVNRADILQRKGRYPPPPGKTSILGLEAAGIIHKIGSSVKKWKVGDKVMALCNGGGYAQYVSVHENHVMPIPSHLNYVSAAAIPEVWLTAFQLLHTLGKIKSGETVLIHAGGSGVGTAAIQLAKLAQTDIITTAGTKQKLTNAKMLGAKHSICYKTESFDEEVMKFTKDKGVDLLLDCVGGSYWEKNLKCLARDARWILYGLLGGPNVDGNIMGQLLSKRIQLIATTLRSRSDEIGKTKFHKSQLFDLTNDEPKFVGEAKPGIGGEIRTDQKLPAPHTRFPKGEGQTLPTWIAFDRQVLTFYAYFKEAVHERNEEQYRVKQCKIYFYLEDDTIQVTELQKKNSGIFQGTIIRRHRIPKPPPDDDKFYTLEDFNIQNTVEFYSKVFKIIDCDQFTHSFLYKIGVRLRDPCPLPDDPYTQYRKTLEDAQQPLRPHEKYDPLGQFLLHDREVLRFYCLWDDTENMFGDAREMVMHFYLADDTVEVNEVIKINSGRDNVPQFLKRGKLPKASNGLSFPGQATPRTVLNVFGSVYSQNRYIFDSLKTGAIDVPYYTAADFQLGHKINVYGRPLLLCDCDEFTKEFYRAKFGIKEFTPVKRPKSTGIVMEKSYPPYNGFGGEEDSLGNCKDLVPKPPKKNFIQFMEKDKQGFDSYVLRFLAKLESNVPTDKHRNFIISYFLCDDTMEIYEPRVSNSGIAGGKFLARDLIKKPGQPRFNNKDPDYYKAQDLSIGQTVEIASHRFTIIDADEYALNYMESHSNEFPKSDVKAVIENIRRCEKYGEEQVTKKFLFKDPESCDLISFTNMADILIDLHPNITEHELLTIGRHYEEKRGRIENPIVKILAEVRENLRKNNYDNYEELLNSLQYEDKENYGFLLKTTIRLLMLAQQIPLKQDLLTRLLTNYPDDQQDVINFHEMISDIDWRKDNLPIKNLQAERNRSGIKRTSVDSLNYRRLLADLYPRSS